MKLKEIFKPTWKNIGLFILISFVYIYIAFTKISFFNSIYTSLKFLYFFLYYDNGIYLFNYIFGYVISCLLIFIWDKFKKVNEEKIRPYEWGVFFGILINLVFLLLSFLFEPLNSLLYLINLPFYWILFERGLGYLFGCMINLTVCSDEGSILFWKYLIPILSGIIYGLLISWIYYTIKKFKLKK